MPAPPRHSSPSTAISTGAAATHARPSRDAHGEAIDTREATPHAAPSFALVLGAGGPVGHAFEVTCLAAFERATGLDARDAALIVGTSAGAQVAAMLRLGMSAHDMAARVRRQPMSAAGERLAAAFVRPEPVPAAHTAAGSSAPWHARATAIARRMRPVAPGLLVQAALRPGSVAIGAALSAALPRGARSLRGMAAAIDANGEPPGAWPVAPTWLVALELAHGRRVVLGREPSSASVGVAVAASCAVPGVFEQVRIDGALLGDGGLLSGTHADLVAEAHAQGELPGLAFTLVISPLSAYLPPRRALRRELASFAPAAPPTLVLEPGPRARRAMGLRPLDVHRVGPMAEATAADLAADPRVLEALARVAAAPQRPASDGAGATSA